MWIDLKDSDIFTVQDEITDRVAATVADNFGVVVQSMVAALEGKPEEQSSPNEYVLRFFGYYARGTPEEHARIRTALERAVEKIPRNADLWGCLSIVYQNEYIFHFNELPNSLARCLVAAQRAVELNRASQIAYEALALSHFFRRDLAAFPAAAERAMALNPRNSNTLATIGLLLAHTREFERGAKIMRRAIELNPHHAGWFHFPLIWDHYSRGEYEQVLERAKRVNMPGFLWTPVVVASVCGQLGRKAEAAAAVNELLAIDPEFAANARRYIEPWHYASGFLEPLLEGLRKAGLNIRESKESPASQTQDAAEAQDLNTNTGSSSRQRVAAPDWRATREEEGFWVAVLPFQFRGTDPGLEALAEGLSEDIVAGLSRFSYLNVIAHSSTSSYARKSADVRTVGTELGARYIMEGSIRQAGSTLRILVQLVDASSGAQLWTETYERAFNAESIFELQDDLVPRIVSTVADMHGVLPRSMSEVVRLKAADQMSPYEALLRSFGYNERFTPEDLAEVRTCLERAVQQSPGNAECWAMLSLMYANEYGHWDNAGPDSLDRSLQAARKAVEAAPLHSLPYYALAQALFFKREIPAFRVAAERAVSLNPMNGATAAFMGLLIAYAGDWERGCALSDKGSQLNPNHPGWYRYTAWHDAYRKKDYRKALDVALHLNAPQNYYTHAVLAICYAQLGQMEEAHKALRDMLALKPNYAEVARELHGRWIDPDLVEQLMDGLRKAGLEIPDPKESSAPQTQEVKEAEPAPETSLSSAAQRLKGDVSSGSGERISLSGAQTRSPGGAVPWIAVLPLKYQGTDPEVESFADGLTEDITTGLSRFSYLFVVSRNSTSRYKGQSVDVRQVGEELGARYLLEGGIRKSGKTIRVNIEVVDSLSGTHLWAESYDRNLESKGIFAIQDEITDSLVATVADPYGVVTRSMAAPIASRAPDSLTPYEAVLRFFVYLQRAGAEDHLISRTALERAVESQPDYADAWACLAQIVLDEYHDMFNPRPDALDRALQAARRAVEVDPASQLGHFALAQAYYFRQDLGAFRAAADHAISLNRRDGNTIAFLGIITAYGGDWERGVELTKTAMALNPHHPGWYRFAMFFDHYRKGEYAEALAVAQKINMPNYYAHHCLLAISHAQLGNAKAAKDSAGEVLRLYPDFEAKGKEEWLDKWLFAQPALVEQIIEGLQKAGVNMRSAEELTQVPEMPSTSIAVLPFSDLSPQKDQDYFCDGVAEEIINALAKVEGLRVAARTSAFVFRGQTLDINEIARNLKVATVLEGSVRKAGNRVRITTQLIDVKDGCHLWADRFDRELDDIFAIQDEIATAIATKLRGTFPVESNEPLVKRHTRNAEAYELYLRGRHAWQKFGSDLYVALKYFERAAALDSEFAQAHAGIADVYGTLGFTAAMRPRESMPKAKAAAQRALELDDQLAEAHCSLAYISMIYDWNWEAAEKGFLKSIDLNPNYAQAMHHYGHLFHAFISHRIDEGIDLCRRAAEIDPLAGYPRHGWFANLYIAGRLSEAIDHLKEALGQDESAYHLRRLLGLCYMETSMMDEAQTEMEEAVRASGRHSWAVAELGCLYARTGRTAEAESLQTELLTRSRGVYVQGSVLAMIPCWLGKLDEAFSHLDRALEDRDGVIICITSWPIMRPLWSDPRYESLLKRIGLTNPRKSSAKI